MHIQYWKYNNCIFNYLFRAIWNVLGQNGIGHLFHIKTSFTLQNKILIFSLQANIKPVSKICIYHSEYILSMYCIKGNNTGTNIATILIGRRWQYSFTLVVLKESLKHSKSYENLQIIFNVPLCVDLSYAEHVSPFSKDLIFSSTSWPS